MATRRINPASLLAASRRNVFSIPSYQPRSHFLSNRQFHCSVVRFDAPKANTSAKRDPAPKIIRGQSKVFKNADEAVADIKSGATILSAGFGLCGTAGKYL